MSRDRLVAFATLRGSILLSIPTLSSSRQPHENLWELYGTTADNGVFANCWEEGSAIGNVDFPRVWSLFEWSVGGAGWIPTTWVPAVAPKLNRQQPAGG